MAIEIDAGPGATTVFIRGELDLVTMPVLAEHLTRAVRGNPGRLVLDMAATDFMDCGSARLIAGAARSLPEGGRLVIRRPAPGGAPDPGTHRPRRLLRNRELTRG